MLTVRGIVLGLLVSLLAIAVVRADNPTIDVLTIKGTINPVLVDYVSRGIDHAESTDAICVIIQIDTPGGLDTAMRDIIQKILNAHVPVIVYVSPAGSRAASAGTYITLSAHIAAMAPATEIGAATPVSLGAEGETQMSEEMKNKVTNDAAAYIRSLATSRGHNADWAEEAVRKGASIHSQEALEQNVIDMVAPDLDHLILQLNGQKVTLLSGRELTLNTTGATVNPVKMNGVENFLFTLADPNIAYILLSLAMLGLTVEITNPGLIFPGVIGGISLLLALYSLGMLPVNYTGILLIVLAFILFIAEIFVSSGLLGLGGLISLVFGSLILFKGGSLFQVNPWLIAVIAILLVTFFTFAVTRVVQIHRQQATTGREELKGKVAVVRVALDPEGQVFWKGELWKAISESGRIELNEEVTITKADGLTLYVTRKEQKEAK